MKLRVIGALAVTLASMFVAVATPQPVWAAGPASSPLPGYPRFHGVVLVHDGSVAAQLREAKIKSALASASAGPRPNCEERERPATDVCYRGGPVVRAHKVHLIFWEGEASQGHSISLEYRHAIERYFELVGAASGTESNVYAVQAQYGDTSGKGEYRVSFEGEAIDVYRDENKLPAEGTTAGECVDHATKNGVCVTDNNLREQVEKARIAENGVGHPWEESLHDIYFVFMPAKVGSCFYGVGEEETEPNACAFESYCAYHSSFETAKKPRPPLYASIPDDAGVVGCDSFEYHNGAEGVDATLDATSHEHNETISDPLGDGWLDSIGQEVGDKCLPPETFEIYGGALGGELEPNLKPPTATEPGSAFNQEIDGGDYWLQREWSNEAGLGGGACVQRRIKASFSVPASRQATVPMTLDGSSSGEPGDPITYWIWNFINPVTRESERQIGTSEPTVSYSFPTAGRHEVGLTVFDRYGNSQAILGEFTVGAAPPPPPPPAPPAPPVVIKEVIVPGRYTAPQVAAALGLPPNGKKLSGLGPFSLGHAACPPACGVSLQLFAKETKVSRKHRTIKWVLVGSAHLTLAAKGAGALTLTLNAKGKALLRKAHTAAGRLIATVEGQEGGSWQIERTLTLKR